MLAKRTKFRPCPYQESNPSCPARLICTVKNVFRPVSNVGSETNLSERNTHIVGPKTYINIIRMGVKLGLSQYGKNRLRVFENRVLSRIFGPKMEELAGAWRRLHSEELHDLCTSANIVTVIKLTRM